MFCGKYGDYKYQPVNDEEKSARSNCLFQWEQGSLEESSLFPVRLQYYMLSDL